MGELTKKRRTRIASFRIRKTGLLCIGGSRARRQQGKLGRRTSTSRVRRTTRDGDEAERRRCRASTSAVERISVEGKERDDVCICLLFVLSLSVYHSTVLVNKRVQKEGAGRTGKKGRGEGGLPLYSKTC